jgi:metal-responsive CopG/Arc/MetJ family transcriptional regulator
MPPTRTITISLPDAMGREVETVAKEEHRTISELFREAFRKYRSQRDLQALALEGRKAARGKKLKAKDFGGPFAK